MDAATFLLQNAEAIQYGIAGGFALGLLYVVDLDIKRTKRREQEELDKADRLYQQKVEYYDRQQALAEHRARALLVSGIAGLEGELRNLTIVGDVVKAQVVMAGHLYDISAVGDSLTFQFKGKFTRDAEGDMTLEGVKLP